MIVVGKLADITTDLYDLEELLKDMAVIDMNVFELSIMRVRHLVYMEGCHGCSTIENIINLWSDMKIR